MLVLLHYTSTESYRFLLYLLLEGWRGSTLEAGDIQNVKIAKQVQCKFWFE